MSEWAWGVALFAVFSFPAWGGFLLYLALEHGDHDP